MTPIAGRQSKTICIVYAKCPLALVYYMLQLFALISLHIQVDSQILHLIVAAVHQKGMTIWILFSMNTKRLFLLEFLVKFSLSHHFLSEHITAINAAVVCRNFLNLKMIVSSAYPLTRYPAPFNETNNSSTTKCRVETTELSSVGIPYI